jgi:hypothetical protein
MQSNIVKLSLVNSTSDLCNQIDRLTAIKEMQEEMLKDSLKTLAHTLEPGVLIKKALHSLSGDDELKQSTLKTSLNFGAQFLLDKVMLGKGVGLKVYLLNMALKKVASFIIAKKMVPEADK